MLYLIVASTIMITLNAYFLYAIQRKIKMSDISEQLRERLRWMFGIFIRITLVNLMLVTSIIYYLIRYY